MISLGVSLQPYESINVCREARQAGEVSSIPGHINSPVNRETKNHSLLAAKTAVVASARIRAERPAPSDLRQQTYKTYREPGSGLR